MIGLQLKLHYFTRYFLENWIFCIYSSLSRIWNVVSLFFRFCVTHFDKILHILCLSYEITLKIFLSFIFISIKEVYWKLDWDYIDACGSTGKNWHLNNIEFSKLIMQICFIFPVMFYSFPHTDLVIFYKFYPQVFHILCHYKYFKISIFKCSLFAYRNTTDFFVYWFCSLQPC
jgi:hypothetical protein